MFRSQLKINLIKAHMEKGGKKCKTIDQIMAAMRGPRIKEGRRASWDEGVQRMNQELDRYGAGHRVSEVYSPPGSLSGLKP